MLPTPPLVVHSLFSIHHLCPPLHQPRRSVLEHASRRSSEVPRATALSNHTQLNQPRHIPLLLNRVLEREQVRALPHPVDTLSHRTRPTFAHPSPSTAPNRPDRVQLPEHVDDPAPVQWLCIQHSLLPLWSLRAPSPDAGANCGIESSVPQGR